MPPISSLVVSLGAMRKRDWMGREARKKIVCGSKCRTGYAMAAAGEQVERQVATTVGSLQATPRRVSCWESNYGIPVPDRYGSESCEKCVGATAGNRVRCVWGLGIV